MSKFLLSSAALCYSAIALFMLTGRVEAFSTARLLKPSVRVSETSSSSPCHRSSGVLYMSSVSATFNETSARSSRKRNRKSYNWTRPTFEIAVPALIGMMADPLLSLMDTAFVGRVGSIELAALGACTSIFHLAFNAFRATTTATTSLVASSLQSDSEQAKQVTSISLKLGIVLGFCVLIGLQTQGIRCLHLMGIGRDSPLFEAAWSYLSTRSWAAPAVLGVVVAEGAFRGYGDTKIPLLASVVASVINLVLDPLLMFPCRLGVVGAAAATAISQGGAALVYALFLRKRKMLPRHEMAWHAATTEPPRKVVDSGKVVGTILRANLAMMAKQGSLLLGWAYATARATRLGAAHVAAHQVALSFWLVFALWLDGAAVSAQVLASRAFAQRDRPQYKSLVKYMMRLATVQGLGSTAMIYILGTFVPTVFTTDPFIRFHLVQLMPHLAWQQLLVSLTLVMESLAVGGNQFNLLAIGTSVSTVLCVKQLRYATTVEAIWNKGIVTLFGGRLITALIGVLQVYRILNKKGKSKEDALET